ncbi:hypothetical protein TNCV_2982641 [Trichonephila clavipes]|nr:hypothetical protein TNCV_2982641 [Trichonephila clavipes]
MPYLYLTAASVKDISKPVYREAFLSIERYIAGPGFIPMKVRRESVLFENSETFDVHAASLTFIGFCIQLVGLSYVNPTPLAHADTSRDVLPRGGTSQLLYIIAISCRQQNVFAAV